MKDGELAGKMTAIGCAEGEPFGLTVCVATRGRVGLLRERMAGWAAAGFDEIVIADNSVERCDRWQTQEMCAHYGCTYLSVRPKLEDQRSHARNLVIARARTPWILIQDDDDEIITGWSRNTLEDACKGVDFLMALPGTEVLALERSRMPFLFRRDLALRVGGYPEFLAGGEDHVLLKKMQSAGRMGTYDARNVWVSVKVPPMVFIAQPVSFVRNLFWYHVGLISVMSVAPSPARFVRGFGRDTLRFVLESLRLKAGVLLAFAGLAAIAFGLLWSPLQFLRHRKELARTRGVPRASDL